MRLCGLSTLAVLLACGRVEVPADTAQRSVAGSSPGIAAAVVSARTGPRAFPPVGIAVRDTALRWCAAFPPDSTPLHPGDTVSLVFATRESSTTWIARLGGSRSLPCDAVFPQPRWDGYRFHDMALVDTSAGRGDASGIALAVVSTAPWGQLGDRRVIADLDGDGRQEEARRCSADEGEHFTIWSIGADGTPRRRAHEYIDWGALVERTCRAGEDGTDSAP